MTEHQPRYDTAIDIAPNEPPPRLDAETLAVLLAWESGVLTGDEARRKLKIDDKQLLVLEHQGIAMGVE